MSEHFAMAGGETMVALEDARKAVQAAALELSQLVTSFYKAGHDENGEIILGTGLKFDIAIKDEISFIYTNAIENEKRLPPKDVREAMAHRAVQVKQPELWAKFHTDKARIDGLRSWISNNKAAISACQSILKGERD